MNFGGVLRHVTLRTRVGTQQRGEAGLCSDTRCALLCSGRALAGQHLAQDADLAASRRVLLLQRRVRCRQPLTLRTCEACLSRSR